MKKSFEEARSELAQRILEKAVREYEEELAILEAVYSAEKRTAFVKSVFKQAINHRTFDDDLPEELRDAEVPPVV